MTRGEIRNKKYASRITDFKGLRYDTITPTDVDVLIEYKNVAWIIGELKYNKADLPYGQSLAFERLYYDLSLKKESLYFVADYYNESGDIVADQAIVRWYLYKQIKHNGNNHKVGELVDRFIKKFKL